MSGGFNPMSFVVDAAAAIATGGTSLIVSAARQAMSSIGQELIQGLGDAIGLPQSVIDIAQGTFASAMGDVQGAQQNWQEAVENFGSLLGFDLFEQASLSNHVQEYMQDMIQQLAADYAREGGEEEGQAGGRAGAGGAAGGAQGAASSLGGGGGSWLQKLAEVMGNKLNQLADEFAEKADALDWDDPAQATKFQATTQEFKMMFEALTTAVKTAGEAMNSAARKQ